MASQENLDGVYDDLVGIRRLMSKSADFKVMVESPGIDPESKSAALGAICDKIDANESVVNFFKVLVENKRLYLLGRMIDLFEDFYRAERNLILCQVTSANTLDDAEEASVEAALTKRAPDGARLIMKYNTNSAVLGGLVVKMGDAVLDNSVATRLDQVQAQLLAPLS
eukprot:NODE_22951_length_687_cov_3.989286.p1 GENE.NODE_22951_length_687_cov_3.989286~~NODE_22951_length_687_cov_3.989286.p1  ORF type:complete len:190 (+),score=90.32 NODE_22951_length_687_cov_3.989286:68-571(+)